MNDFKERTCDECYYWKDNKCRCNPPVLIGGRIDYLPKEPKSETCGLFTENKNQVLLETKKDT